jgi:BirA family transcriptional regulator, biotin operon repressor / biotin---[acetyl-CoA-carboxylase] ligase
MPIPEDIVPAAIQSRLTSRIIGRRLQVVAEIGSTNDAAMGAGQAGEPEGLAILADRQTSGRGRRGRSWASIPGVGVYTSILLRPPVSPRQAPLLTLMAGLAVAEALASVAQLEPMLKWPNDLLLDGRKAVGILTEMTTTGQRIGHVAVGIGVNVHQRREDFPEGVRESATSIDLEAGQRVDRADVVAALYNALDRWYAAVCGDGPSMILQAARARTATLGKLVTVDTGEARWQGTAVDLDDDGALIVLDAHGTVQRVLAADVSIR